MLQHGDGPASRSGANYVTDIEDEIYRIFNPSALSGNATGKSGRRVIVLGKQLYTIKLGLFGKLANLIDKSLLERGDIISVRNVAIEFWTRWPLISCRKIRPLFHRHRSWYLPA